MRQTRINKSSTALNPQVSTNLITLVDTEDYCAVEIFNSIVNKNKQLDGIKKCKRGQKRIK